MGARLVPVHARRLGAVTGPDRAALWEPGWYRFTPAGWEHVTDAEAAGLIGEGRGMDLVRVETVHEEVPLW